uniref:Uncharacterized protein n=1 Tax=Acrobeloides nanus TaxID=290746 RepID=A0A914D0H6_9BILA
MFKGMAVEEQHKFIIDLLPEDLRNDVIVESSALPEESVDREVYLSKVPILPGSKIPATPQFFLDTALYHLSKSSGALSSSCLWFCQRNYYEDDRKLDTIRGYLKYAESFCNALFDIHVSNQFTCEQFKKSLPESMKKKDNIFFDFY